MSKAAGLQSSAAIHAVLAPLGLTRSHDRPLAHGPPVPEVTVLVAADSGTAYPVDPPPIASRLPYPRPRDEPLRFRTELMAPEADFDQAGVELPPAPQASAEATGHCLLTTKVFARRENLMVDRERPEACFFTL